MSADRTYNVPAFIIAQFVGALIAMALAGWLWADTPQRENA